MSLNALLVSWNQFLSFSAPFAKTRAAREVFWSGCAAMKLGSELISRSYAALREAQPALGFSSFCCAKPSFAVGSEEQKNRRRTQLAHEFERSGIEKVYTLCPNCRRTLAREFDIQVLSAWPLLADYAEKRPQMATGFQNQTYRIHDPCADREDWLSQNAARRILQARQIASSEFSHRLAQTRCCGRRDMLFITKPAAAQNMLEERLAEAEGSTILSYCESCVEAFRSAGSESYHLLEILFDQKAFRSTRNRILNARRETRHAR